MSQCDIRQTLYVIMNGTAFVQVKNGQGDTVPFLFRQPSSTDLLWAEIQQRKKKQQLLERKMPTAQQLFQQAIKANQIDPKIHQKIAVLRNQIEELKQLRDRQSFQKAAQRATQFRLDKFKQEIKHLECQILQVQYGSLQQVCSMHKLHFLMSRSVRTLEDKLYWQDFSSFLLCRDSILINNLVAQYSSKMHFDQKTIRAVARSPEWRIRYDAAADKCLGIFGLYAKDISGPQQLLLYWSQLYARAEQAYQAPSRAVIQNDELFDQWLISQSKKNRKKKSGPISDSVGKHSDIFVVADEQGAGDVYSMNDQAARKMQQDKFTKINERGQIAPDIDVLTVDEIRQKVTQARKGK